jgi:NADH dehydrogenase [ubiquinone] 1 alpha subcomplex assembly factor 5
LRSSLLLADLERQGGVTTRCSPLAGVADVANALRDSGYTLCTLDSEAFTLTYSNAAEAFHDMRVLGEQCAAAHRGSEASQRDSMLAAMALMQHLYSVDGQAVELTWNAIWWIGWNPAPTQPKPLTRGSARFSMKVRTGRGSHSRCHSLKSTGTGKAWRWHSNIAGAGESRH